MTQTSSRTGLDRTVELSFTYGLVSDLGFLDLIDTVHALRSLVTLSRLMAVTDPETVGALRHGDIGTGVALAEMVSERATRITRVSYNSPLELTTSLMSGAAVGSAIVIANRLMALHDKFQQSRIIKSDADVHVAANKVIMDELRSRNMDDIADSNDTAALITQAGTALGGITSIDYSLGD